MKNKKRTMYKDGGMNKGNESAQRKKVNMGGRSIYKKGGEVMPTAKPC